MKTKGENPYCWITFLWNTVFDYIKISCEKSLDMYSQKEIEQIQHSFLKLLKYNFEIQPQIVSDNILNDLLKSQYTLRFKIQAKDLLPFILQNDIDILKNQAKHYSEIYPDEINKFQNVLNLLFV